MWQSWNALGFLWPFCTCLLSLPLSGPPWRCHSGSGASGHISSQPLPFCWLWIFWGCPLGKTAFFAGFSDIPSCEQVDFFGLMKSIYHPFAKSIQSPGAVYWNIPEIRCSGVPCTPFGVMWHDWCHSTFPFAKLRFDQPWYLKFEKFDELRQIHINETIWERMGHWFQLSGAHCPARNFDSLLISPVLEETPIHCSGFNCFTTDWICWPVALPHHGGAARELDPTAAKDGSACH